MPKPMSFRNLQEFYQTEYRPLYDKFCVKLRIPQELHVEIAAALDHLMRSPVTTVGDISADDLDRAAGHIKRATFDSFKLLLEEIRRLHDRLMDPRYIDVNDGKFQPCVEKRWREAQSIAEKARSCEQLSDKVNLESWDKAFETWKGILPILETFEDHITSDALIRVQKASRRAQVRKIVYDIGLALFGALVGTLFGVFISR